jgi:hypothetical protein
VKTYILSVQIAQPCSCLRQCPQALLPGVTLVLKLDLQASVLTVLVHEGNPATSRSCAVSYQPNDVGVANRAEHSNLREPTLCICRGQLLYGDVLSAQVSLVHCSKSARAQLMPPVQCEVDVGRSELDGHDVAAPALTSTMVLTVYTSAVERCGSTNAAVEQVQVLCRCRSQDVTTCHSAATLQTFSAVIELGGTLLR